MPTGDKAPTLAHSLGMSDKVEGALSGPSRPQVISQVLFTNVTKTHVGPVWDKKL